MSSVKVKNKRRCLHHLSHDTRFTFFLSLTSFMSLAFYIETNVLNNKIAQNKLNLYVCLFHSMNTFYYC